MPDQAVGVLVAGALPGTVRIGELDLDAGVADAHRRYSARINSRNKWTGHLWQGRYGSVAMDETHLINAIAHISLNPVRAGLVKRATDWPWSSVHAHLAGRDDAVTTVWTTRCAGRNRSDDRSAASILLPGRKAG